MLVPGSRLGINFYVQWFEKGALWERVAEADILALVPKLNE